MLNLQKKEVQYWKNSIQLVKNSLDFIISKMKDPKEKNKTILDKNTHVYWKRNCLEIMNEEESEVIASIILAAIHYDESFIIDIKEITRTQSCEMFLKKTFSEAIVAKKRNPTEDERLKIGKNKRNFLIHFI